MKRFLNNAIKLKKEKGLLRWEGKKDATVKRFITLFLRNDLLKRSRYYFLLYSWKFITNPTCSENTAASGIRLFCGVVLILTIDIGM